MDTLMHTPTDYWPAIELALNHAAGGLQVIDFMYEEEHDIFYVDVEEHGHDYSTHLEGKFVRTCYKASKEGVTSWIEKK